jgi:hypothetical protein
MNQLEIKNDPIILNSEKHNVLFLIDGYDEVVSLKTKRFFKKLVDAIF